VGTAVIGTVLSPSAAGAQGMVGSSPRAPDRQAAVIFGGAILTMEGAAPTYAEAVVIKDGTIVFVGARREALIKAGKGARQVDLKGKALMPGLIDGHTHLMALGAQAVGANLLPSPDGKADTIDALAAELEVFAKSSDVARTGWIFGLGYDDSVLGRHPTKADLADALDPRCRHDCHVVHRRAGGPAEPDAGGIDQGRQARRLRCAVG
jgi:predicted amidohydrolase YtcJ